MNTPSNEPEPEKDFWDLGDDDHKTETPDKLHTPAIKSDAPSSEKKAVPAEETLTIERKSVNHIGEEAETPAPKRRVVKVEHKPTSLFEKISIGIFFLLILGAGAWTLANYYDQAPEGNLITFTEDFPVTGEYITISEAETWWREPRRKGVNPDRGIQLSAKLIPCVQLSINGGSDSTIRYAFRNGEDQIMGDSSTIEIRGGKFEQTGSNTITLNCTVGFKNPSEINPYVNGDTKPWTFEVFEAAAGEIPDRNREPIIEVRIDASYRENPSEEEATES